MKKFILIITLGVILLAGGILLMIRYALQTHNSYGIDGRIAVSSDGQHLVAILAASDAVSYSENGGYRKTSYSTTYYLCRFSIGDGKLLEKKKLFAADELSGHQLSTYGGYNNQFWIYANGLRSFDMNTLEETASEKTIARMNNMSYSHFAGDMRYIRGVASSGFLQITAATGNQYTLNLKTHQLKEKTNKEEPNTEEALQLSSFVLHQKTLLQADTMHGLLYLLADKEEAVKNFSIRNNSAQTGMHRSRLYTARYTMEKLGLYERYSYSNISSSHDSTYLEANLLASQETGKAIQLSSPEGYLLVHRNMVTNDANCLITRVDAHCQPVWQCNTGISMNISECFVTGNYCIVSGRKKYMFSPYIGNDAVSIINLRNGSVTALQLPQ